MTVTAGRGIPPVSHSPTDYRLVWRHVRLALPVGVGLGALMLTPPAAAIPSFADQTGLPCQACHIGGFGPQLTAFGRGFKLDGYTLRTKPFNVPVSAMAIASYNHTRADQVPPPDRLAANDNVVLDQASVFLGGGIGQHIGGMAQVTYDGVAHHWSWDNFDLRLVNKARLFGTDATYGFDVNNSPTVQDPFNTIPAWGFPYSDQGVGQAPGAGPLINGALAQQVLGVSAYAWINHHWYVEAGGYSTPRPGTLAWLGADPVGPGDISGIAPYGRVAWQQDVGTGTMHLGAFGLRAALHPGRDRTTTLTDHYRDIGLDASYILPTAKGDTFSLQARYTHESLDLAATCALATLPLTCANSTLSEVRGDIGYVWRGKIGLTLGAFAVTGPANAQLYGGPLARPDSNGGTAQIDYTPWGAGNGPLGPLVQVRFGAQYTAYGQFNGTRFNYDGTGAKAADNNIARLFAWIAF